MLELTERKILCFRETHQNKNRIHRMEKLTVKQISDERLVFIIFKKFSQLNNRKVTQLKNGPEI